MARITVEDCLEKIPNRFQLVLAATYRARMLSQGHAPKVETKNKPGVTALREIAAGEIGIEMLRKVPIYRPFRHAPANGALSGARSPGDRGHVVRLIRPRAARPSDPG